MTRVLRLLLATASIVLCVGALSSTAHAHSGIQSYVYVSIDDSSVEGRVEYPADDLGEALGITFPSDPDAAEEVAVANADAIRAYTAEHLRMADPDGEWTLSFTEDPTILPAAGNYVVVPFEVLESFDGAPRTFEVEYDGIIHVNPERDALFIVENDWGTARFDNEGEHLLGFSVGMTTQLIELEDVGTISSMAGARGLGTDAVRAGVDHILFVVALLLPVALVPLGGSIGGPAPTLAGATRRAAILLGIFVAANTIVLWVFGLAAVDWSSEVVGTLLAASLLAITVFAVWRFTTREQLVVGVLGAVQGIGFAHAYLDRQLDRVDTPLALLAFNIGVEIAIVIVALMVFPLLLILRRTALAAVTLYGVAGLVGLYALAWLVERPGIVDVDMEQFANPLRVWPRNLFLMLVAWAAAGALYAWTSKRGSLRPIEADDSTPSADRPMVMS